MELSANREERIEVRLSSVDKQLFKRAQKLSGDKTFSGFVLRILKQYSTKLLAENDQILISERDREIFFAALLEDSQPNEALIEAAKLYKERSK